ncbi:MAG: hypothetical protein AAFQ82_27575, partial [Myxococcota bacterium]
MSTEGGGIVAPSLLPAGTASPVTASVSIDGTDLTGSTPLTLVAELGIRGRATTTVTVVPPLAFAGIGDALVVDSDNATVSWTEATGGSGGYTYTVFRSDAAGMLGDPLAPTVAEGTTTSSVSIADGVDGDVFYFAVRVADSLGGEVDNNLVQASVRKGAVVYVDASNAGTADGGPGTPFTTVGAAVAALTSGGSIYVSTGTYQELPLNYAATAGIQLFGGFTGFTDSTTTASDWMRNGANTALTFTGTNPTMGPLLQTGDDAVVSRFDLGLDVTTGDVLLSSAGSLDVRNSVVGSGDETAGTGNRISTTAETTLSGSTVTRSHGTRDCA